MKFVSMDKIYELSDEVGSAYVDVCLIDNELATERVIPIEVLEEIRQEITNLVKTYPFIDHMDSYVKETEVLKILNRRLKELSE